jgi:hypothetical protein
LSELRLSCCFAAGCLQGTSAAAAATDERKKYTTHIAKAQHILPI